MSCPSKKEMFHILYQCWKLRPGKEWEEEYLIEFHPAFKSVFFINFFDASYKISLQKYGLHMARTILDHKWAIEMIESLFM